MLAAPQHNAPTPLPLTSDDFASVPAPATPFRRYQEVRGRTEQLCAPLQAGDFELQAMPEASPPKWHLAHTSWFFEAFILRDRLPGYGWYDARYPFLFNSYYEGQGPRVERGRRGLLSRPSVEEVFRYRHHVDEAMRELLTGAVEPEVAFLLELGLQHEQQHQELLLMDLLVAFASEPLRPAYRFAPALWPRGLHPAQSRWLPCAPGIRWLGAEEAAFAFDIERPRHRVYVDPFRVASRLVTNGEYLEFIEAGGYDDPSLWLFDGWNLTRSQGWRAPLYWNRQGDDWWTMTLHGPRPLPLDAPVCHVSYFEADAYARWRGARLPTEAEWETAAGEWGTPAQPGTPSNCLESGALEPLPAWSEHDTQFLGHVWEWTASAYLPYPGFRPWPGTLGEYNAKFTNNQYVLRGGSCLTPRAQLRTTYRNYFSPESRWQFSGIRLVC